MSHRQKQKKPPFKAAASQRWFRLGSSGSGRLAIFSFYAIIIGVVLLLGSYRQNITDWYKLQSYQAPNAVSELAAQDTLTSTAKKIFYVNEPQLQPKPLFAGMCPNGTREQTIVLGCYHGKQNGIFLLDVTDSRLEGVEQVTAAHEMLHAAYDRLSGKEKKHVNAMLTDYYQNGLKDDRIRKTIDAYRESEPTELVNEMHSIFGTEVPNLPPGLEKYYQKYFASREKVTDFAAKYQAEFTSRHDAVATMDKQLGALKSQIEDSESALKTKQGQIETRRDALYAMRNNGDISGFNAGVSGYNNLVDSYNDDVAYIKNLINQYNDLVGRRNAIAVEEGQLVDELKTNVDTIQQ
jgi:hypothetical protein